MIPIVQRWCVGAALMLWAALACAQSDSMPTGLDLLKRCNALEQAAANDSEEAEAELVEDYGYCLGYLVGFVSGFAARDVAGVEGRFCPPDNARIEDFAHAIQGWLVEHPEGLEKLGAYVAASAFKWKFPCRAR